MGTESVINWCCFLMTFKILIYTCLCIARVHQTVVSIVFFQLIPYFLGKKPVTFRWRVYPDSRWWCLSGLLDFLSALNIAVPHASINRYKYIHVLGHRRSHLALIYKPQKALLISHLSFAVFRPPYQQTRSLAFRVGHPVTHFR
jgi:hypothetical protein